MSSSVNTNGVKFELPAPFIVGTGRCGTTLLRLMLDAHPDIAIPPETHFIPEVYRACKNTDSEATECIIDSIVGSKYWHDFHIDAEELRERIHETAPIDIGEALRAFYKLYADRFGKLRWGDKTPRYWEDMRLIQEILPEAHFIHLIRDGRDTALSVLKDHWGPADITTAAEWWVNGIKCARKQASELGNYLEIRYEHLILDTENTLRLICKFIDLPWNDIMLDYHQNASERLDELQPVKLKKGVLSTQKRKGHFHMTSKPPSSSRIARWETEMTTQDLKTFERIAGPLLDNLGYRVSIDLTSEILQTPWVDRLDHALSKVIAFVPDCAQMILMDQEEWGIEGMIDGRTCFKFLEKDGQYWGPPADDDTGISEIERLRDAGAEYLVCAWPAFWWLQHYPRFNRHLRNNYKCLVECDDVVIFNLQEQPCNI